MGEDRHLPKSISLDEMRTKHPLLYEKCFDCSVGGGWRILVESLNDRLIDYNSREDNEEFHFQVHQVKEKFGGLRYYYRGGNPDDDLQSSPHSKYMWKSNNIKHSVYALEALSYRICERCGAPAQQYDDGWIMTACLPCRVRYLEGSRERTLGYISKYPEDEHYKSSLKNIDEQLTKLRTKQKKEHDR